MPAIINTNIASLNAQRNLQSSQTALQVSLQRLSSGLRINSAKDDAAGLAISERFSTQIRGLNQAARNANDGISLAQTGEGALAAVTDNLQRIRELAVQSANSTNSEGDRIAINLEVQQRLAEIDRTASQTSFNGTKLLDGSFTSSNFQIGSNAGEVIGVNVEGNTRISATGAIASTNSSVLGAGSSGRVVISPATRNFGTTAVSFEGGTNSVATAVTDFSVAGSALTSGRVEFTATDFNFAAPVNYVAGKSGPQATTDGYNFSVAAPTAATNTLVADSIVTTGAADFQTAAVAAGGAAAHFDLTDDSGTYTIALDDADYASTDVGFAQMATDITTKLTAAGSNTVATFVADTPGVTGHFVFTSGETGAASVAPTLSNIGADLAALGMVEAGGNHTPGVNATAGSITVDNTVINLSANYADRAAMAVGLTGLLQGSALGAGYSAAVVGTDIVISNATDGTNTNAVSISAVTGGAVAANFTVNTTGVAGTAADAGSNPTTMTIGGTSVVLDQNYGSYANMAAAISTQLGGSYTVASNQGGVPGAILISRTSTGAGSTAVDISGDGASDAAGITAGGVRAGIAGTDEVASKNTTFTVGTSTVTLNANYTNQAGVLAAMQSQLTGYNVTRNGDTYSFQSLTSSDPVVVAGIDAAETASIGAGFVGSAGTEGTAAVSTTNASLTIGGQAITLDGDYASFDAMAAAIESKMDTAAGSDTFTVTNNNGALTIARNTTGIGSAAVAITVADDNAIAAGFTVQAGTAGAAGVGAVTTSNLSINGTTVAGTFDDAAALATEINSTVSGVYAKVDADTNVMTLSSAAEIVLAGSDVTTLGLNGAVTGTVAASTGSLALANVLTADDANTTIQRIDAALNSVSNLRSTFGAIQNRFESVISSLTATSENLTAARSRIQDTDFAAETAQLTRNQILQQAGTAMLAQANQLPNTVLSLLR